MSVRKLKINCFYIKNKIKFSLVLDCIPNELCGLVWDTKLPCCSYTESNKQPLTSTTTAISINSPSNSHIQTTATEVIK